MTEIDDFAHKQESYCQLARCYERLGSYREATRARELQVRDCTDSLPQTLGCRGSDEVENEIVDSSDSFWPRRGLTRQGATFLTATLKGQIGRFVAQLKLTLSVSVHAPSWVRSSSASGVLKKLMARSRMPWFLQRRRSKDTRHSVPRIVTWLIYAALVDHKAAKQANQRAAELGWKGIDEGQRVVSVEAVEQNSVS